jgi:hypothetical protein
VLDEVDPTEFDLLLAEPERLDLLLRDECTLPVVLAILPLLEFGFLLIKIQF